MAEQFHHSGKADAGAKHFGGIGMSKLMRHNACEQADGMADLAPVIAQLTDESFFGTRPWQQHAIGGEMPAPESKESLSHVTFLLNFSDELRRKVPAGK